jgi:hypothetical protein
MEHLGADAEELEHTLCEGFRANLACKEFEAAGISEEEIGITCRSKRRHWEAFRRL